MDYFRFCSGKVSRSKFISEFVDFISENLHMQFAKTMILIGANWSNELNVTLHWAGEFAFNDEI